MAPIPPSQLNAHLTLLCQSYQRLTGRVLLDCPYSALVTRFNEAPFALVSHGIEADPVFNYGNATALKLFAMDWAQFTALPSRLSAEPPNQREREHLLRTVKSQGFIDGYAGVRIASDGRRFMIEQVTVWNVVDESGDYHGQAAVYSEWHDVD